jgi:hypothetical protein
VLQFSWAAENVDNKSTRKTSNEHLRQKGQAMARGGIQHKMDNGDLWEVGLGELYLKMNHGRLPFVIRKLGMHEKLFAQQIGSRGCSNATTSVA